LQDSEVLSIRALSIPLQDSEVLSIRVLSIRVLRIRAQDFAAMGTQARNFPASGWEAAASTAAASIRVLHSGDEGIGSLSSMRALEILRSLGQFANWPERLIRSVVEPCWLEFA